MTRSWITAALLACSASVSPLSAQQRPVARDSLVITFLANEGVMLLAGGTSVLIDALFGDGLRGHGVVSEETRALLERSRAPFDRVAFVLATHIHKDHFDADAVARHLRANPRATFVSTTQAVQRVRAAAGDERRLLERRLTPISLPLGARRRIATAGSATIYALGVPHAPGSKGNPANIGFVVDIGGHRVLHIGDSQEGAATFAALRLDELGIDVALLPFWYLTGRELRDVVRTVIRPTSIGALHMPQPTRLERAFTSREEQGAHERQIRSEFPGARIFARELERWVVR